MGKRTSDFVALATVLGGVGVGFGLTSLFARSAPVALVDDVSVHDVSVKVRIVPGRVLVRDGYATSTIYFRRAGELRAEVVDIQREVREIQEIEVLLMADVAERRKELEREAQQLYEETLEELDCLGPAVRGDEDEDQRRRRRRRRPCR
jgi:hypothetical protein